MSEHILIGGGYTFADVTERIKKADVPIKEIKQKGMEASFQTHPIDFTIDAVDATYILNTLVHMGQSANYINDAENEQRIMGMMVKIIESMQVGAEKFLAQHLTETESGV